MADEEVREKLDEAAGAHEAAPPASAPAPGQPEATVGAGVEPAETGYAPPDTGSGEAAESEIPVGVDALDSEKVEAAKAAAEEGGDDDALDVSAIVQDEGGDAAAEAPDAGGDDEIQAEAEAEPPDAEAEAEPPDAEAGDEES
jgi:hypothetical protein